MFPTREEEGRMGGKNKRTRNEKTSSLRIKIKWQNLRERGEASSNFLKLGFDSGAGIGGGPLELWLTAGRDQLSGLANKSRELLALKPDIGSRCWQTNLLAVKFYRYYHCYYYNRVERTRIRSHDYPFARASIEKSFVISQFFSFFSIIVIYQFLLYRPPFFLLAFASHSLSFDISILWRL